MNRLTLAKASIVVLIALFIGAVIGYYSLQAIHPDEPELLTKEYMEYYGFKEVKGGGLIRPWENIVEGDTIRSTIVLLPAERDNRHFWVLGFAQDNRFFAVDGFYTVEEFDRWRVLFETSR